MSSFSIENCIQYYYIIIDKIWDIGGVKDRIPQSDLKIPRDQHIRIIELEKKKKNTNHKKNTKK